MKSIKSVKVFLFCIAAVLTVLFAVTISKPHNTVKSIAGSNVNKNYDVNANLTEDTANFYEITDFTDLSESESDILDENSEFSYDESEPSVTASVNGNSTSQTTPSVTQKPENTTAKPVTTVPAKTENPTVSQTKNETADRQPTVSDKPVSDDHEQMTVYYTKTGKRYHYENPCGKGTYYPTTLAEAKVRGLTPCKKCVLH